MFLHSNNTISEREMKKSSFCNFNRKNETPTDELNKQCEGYMHLKLQCINKKIEETHRN